MRIGIAWAKALLPVGFVLFAAATAAAQYAPAPYDGQPGGPPMQPVYFDQMGMQPDMMPPPEAFADPGANYPIEGGVDERGMPYLGQPRPYGTGGISHPRWFDVSADYMIFTRDNSPRFVPYSSLGAGGPIVLSTDFLNFDTSSGFRVTGNYLIGPGRNIEASYFGTFNFAANSQAVAGAVELNSPFSDFGTGAVFTAFDDSDLHRIAYSTNLHSAELNLRQRYISPNGRVHTSLLAGFRYLCIDEDFLFIAQSGGANGEYLVGTSNDLMGFQLGGDLCVALLPRFKFGVEGKAGIYGNDAQVRNRITETVGPATATVFEAASANNASFVGEAGAFMIVHVTPRWNLKAGYQCLVATGLAIAPENFNRDPNFGARPVSVNVGGHAFYHGGQAGFEYIY